MTKSNLTTNGYADLDSKFTFISSVISDCYIKGLCHTVRSEIVLDLKLSHRKVLHG